MSEREDYADSIHDSLIDRLTSRRFIVMSSIVLALAVLVFLIVCSAYSITDRHYNVYTSILDAEKLIKVIKFKYPNGNYPAKLEDIRRSLPGREAGEEANYELLDAWGNPFHYVVVPNAKGLSEVYIWAEWTRDGKTTLHGAKLTAGKSVVKFGLPED